MGRFVPDCFAAGSAVSGFVVFLKVIFDIVLPFSPAAGGKAPSRGFPIKAQRYTGIRSMESYVMENIETTFPEPVPNAGRSGPQMNRMPGKDGLLHSEQLWQTPADDVSRDLPSGHGCVLRLGRAA